MNDLDQAFADAWAKVGPMLRDDPDELKARLARRRSRMYLRPLRAFCLAVRASDLRINLARAIIVPEHAMDLGSEWHPGRMIEHKVYLDKRVLREICRPVEIEPPGEPWYDVAKRLGCSPMGLRALRLNGTLRVHYIQGLSGRRGPATPLVYTPEALDPSALGKRGPDPIWGCFWRYHAQWLPEDFEQALVRSPMYEVRHGRDQLWGWRWICPGCKRQVRTVYLPLRVPDWGAHVGFKCDDEVDEAPEVNACFACMKCHGVINFSRAGLRQSWDQLVLHYSGGLMYGKEVKWPEWLKVERKRAYRARPREAKRRDELERWLVRTSLSLGEIAAELGIKYHSVRVVAGLIYRRHGVHGREELRKAVPAEAERVMKAVG